MNNLLAIVSFYCIFFSQSSEVPVGSLPSNIENGVSAHPVGERDLQISQKYFTTTDLGAINYTAALGNPFKGLADGLGQNPLSPINHALEYTYVMFAKVLVEPDTYDWTELERMLNEVAERDRHLIPRFYMHWVPWYPELPPFLSGIVEMRQHNDFGGGWSPYYGDPNLLDAMQKFIAAFGAKYDGDPRIAFIQMGLLGKVDWRIICVIFLLLFIVSF
jgi:hypothetical protein